MERVLLVLADVKLRQVLEGLLLDQGHRVTVAGTLEEGLSRLAADNPGLVVLVAAEGTPSVAAALAAVRRAEPRVPTIIVSPGGSAREAIEVTKAGAFEYFLTPLDGAAKDAWIEKWHVAEAEDGAAIVRALLQDQEGRERYPRFMAAVLLLRLVDRVYQKRFPRPAGR